MLSVINTDMEWLTLVLLTLLLLITGTYLIKKMRFFKRFKSLLDEFPGPKPHTIIGSFAEYMVSRDQFEKVFTQRFKEYGPVLRVWNLTYIDGDLFVAKPEYLEVILSSTKHIRKGRTYDRMQPWLGTGLLTSTGSKWYLHRKLITPAFHFKILEDFFEVFVEKSSTLVTKMKELPMATIVDLMPLITRCTLDIICETAMGTKMDIQNTKNHDEYVKTVYELSELMMQREFAPWLWPACIFYMTSRGKQFLECVNILHNFTEKVIQERKSERAGNGNIHINKDSERMGTTKKLALLDLLLETSDGSHPLTDLEIREEVDTFMFEGHDTTAMALTWSLYLLGRHRHIQDAVWKELELIFDGSQRPPTLQDLANMKYLERVIKESLRLYPSVPFITRLVEENLPLGDGLIIPAGTHVIIDVMQTHRDPQQFPDPYNFNPDHFLPERSRERHPFAYIPFSAGPRNCIGQKFAMTEEKTVLSCILRKFRLEAVEVEDEMVRLRELTLKPLYGLQVKLTPR